MVKGIIPFAHDILTNTVIEGDIVVDATCGNGNDTLFLAKLVGKSGHIYSFDIQKQAIDQTKTLLKENNFENVTYVHDSHANIRDYIPIDTKIAGAIFNLGYLPRSDKQIITKGDSTIAAIKGLLHYLKKSAYIVIVIYHGHIGGSEEKQMILDFVTTLEQKDFAVLQYQFINQKNNPPFIVAIERK